MSCPHCHGPDRYVLDSLGDCVPSGEYEHHYLCGALPREAFYTPSEMPLSTRIDAATFGRAIARAVKKNPYSSNWALVAMAVEIATGEEISDMEEVPELIDRIIKEDSWDLVRVVTNNFQVTEIIETEITYRAAQSIQSRPRPDNDLLCIVRLNQYKVGDRWVG